MNEHQHQQSTQSHNKQIWKQHFSGLPTRYYDCQSCKPLAVTIRVATFCTRNWSRLTTHTQQQSSTYNLWNSNVLFPAPILVSVGVLQSVLYDRCSASQHLSTQAHHMCSFFMHSSAMYWQGVPVSAHLSTHMALPPVERSHNNSYKTCDVL